jgi:hypothetical protein
MEKLSFLNPEFFWLLLLIPAAAAWLYLKTNGDIENKFDRWFYWL